MFPKPSYEGGYLSLSMEQLSPSLLFCSNLNEVGTTKARAGSSVANCCQFLPPDTNNAVQGSRMSLFIPFCGVSGLIGLVGSYCVHKYRTSHKLIEIHHFIQIHQKNTEKYDSIASVAKGALAHHLQRRTAC